MKEKSIVLLHGWGATTGKLDLLKNSLTRLGWKVYLPKLPGFEAAPPRSAWNLSDYSNYVSSISQKHFGHKYFVFGHSFGGRIAIRMGASGRKDILGLVLCSSGGLSRGNILKRLVFYILAKIGKLFLLMPPLARVFKNFLYKAAQERDYFKTEGVMKATFRNIVREDLKKAIKGINIPTLVLWGMVDMITPIKDAFYLVNNIKTDLVDRVFFENRGHRLPYEKPDALALEIEKWYKSLT